MFQLGYCKIASRSKSGFSWNKYESDPKTSARSQYLNHLVDPSFQGINILFVLSFESANGITSYSEYYLQKIQVKD